MPLKQMSKAVSPFRSELVYCQEEVLQISLLNQLKKRLSAPNPDIRQRSPLKSVKGAAHDADKGIQAKIRFSKSL